MKKILIIEDDSSIAELERDYLEINDFECEIAARGTTGLEKALAENFDLIIIDIMLPGMDGFEVITELRKKKQTPVIFLSAKNTDIDKIRGLGLGIAKQIVEKHGGKIWLKSDGLGKGTTAVVFLPKI